MRHKHKSSDSSFESDSCDYSCDDADNEATKHRQHAKKQQAKDKSKSFDKTEAKNNSRKEDEDDGSVSDDSLEVIVVKRSLEKKCEKVISGSRSKIPRECTKETKLTKTHKRSSKSSRANKSRPSDKDKNTIDQDKSLGKKERSVVIEELAHTSAEEEEDGSEKIIESQFRRDATDSTSQETVERVVVTAIVHKDQIPDTPRSMQETAKEASSDNVLRKKTIVIEETKETFKSVNSSDKSKTAFSHKTDTHDISEERLQRVTQENLQVNEEVESKDEKNKIKMSSNMEDAKEGTNGKIQKISA